MLGSYDFDESAGFDFSRGEPLEKSNGAHIFLVLEPNTKRNGACSVLFYLFLAVPVCSRQDVVSASVFPILNFICSYLFLYKMLKWLYKVSYGNR